jgi:hypothetical protein
MNSQLKRVYRQDTQEHTSVEEQLYDIKHKTVPHKSSIQELQVISKEEIKAKKQATIKRNKEEAEQKKASGIDTCRGCNIEFQKIDTKAATTCSWECALSASQTGNLSYLGGGKPFWTRDNGKCWTSHFLETVVHKHQERELKDVADDLYLEKEHLKDVCSALGCERMNRKCVNWHHFKVYSDIEWLLRDSEKEDIAFYLEKMIKNSKDIIIECLSYTHDEGKDLPDKFDEIEEENKKIKECREILERIKVQR